MYCNIHYYYEKKMKILFFLFVLVVGDEYISCGTDDEGEQQRCCVAMLLRKFNSYCADTMSGDPQDQCSPWICSGKRAQVFVNTTTQTNCLNEFLDIDPQLAGSCEIVTNETCFDYIDKYPSICTSMPIGPFKREIQD
jgi:hypothetical protein